MEAEQVVSDRDRWITVYKQVTDAIEKKLKVFLVQIHHLEEMDFSQCSNLCGEIKAFICEQISDCMAKVDNKLSEFSGEYHEIGHGSTSYCYSLTLETNEKKRPVLLKEFHPALHVKEDITLCESDVCDGMPQCGLYWIADSALKNFEKVKAFLCDFKRFIEQKEQMTEIIKDSHLSGSDSYMNPDLYISSAGFVYVDQAFCGSTLSDTICQMDKLVDKEGYSVSDIKDRFAMVLQIAESVAVYHKNDYFNGDLKPSNLFQIMNNGTPKFVRNIDFDTCINVEKDIKDKSYFKTDIRTTRFFYSTTGIRLLANDIKANNEETLKQARKCLLKFDIAAIANILIYTFLSPERRKAIMTDENELALVDFGFYGEDGEECVSKLLFSVLNCENSLSRLAIFKKIHNLILNSLEVEVESQFDIEEFINRLNLIIAYLDCIEAPDHINDYLKNKEESFNKDIPMESLIYFANLLRLDNMIKDGNIPFRLEDKITVKYEFSPDPNANTPEDYIQKTFYEE